MLGRTAALLALVVLVLGFAGTVDVGLERFLGFPLEPRWLKYTLLIGIPVLIVGAQILAEWQAERKRRQAQALAVKTEAVREGYFRIGPYLDTADDRAKFDRADRIHEKVLDWIKRADAIPLYLTGDSGSGKSSVLNAFVLPGAERRRLDCRRGAGLAGPGDGARRGDRQARRRAQVEVGRGEDSARAARSDRAAGRGRGFCSSSTSSRSSSSWPGSERQKAFAAFLADLRARPIKGLKLLLVLRSDYTTAIDELGLPLLRQGENWQEVGRFTLAAGTKFMARSGLALQQDALDRLAVSASELDDSPGMIRPITLNVVGHVLSEGRATAPSLDAGRLVRLLHRAVGRTARHSRIRAARSWGACHRAGHQTAALRAGACRSDLTSPGRGARRHERALGGGARPPARCGAGRMGAVARFRRPCGFALSRTTAGRLADPGARVRSPRLVRVDGGGGRRRRSCGTSVLFGYG